MSDEGARYRVLSLRLGIEESEEALRGRAAERLGVSPAEVASLQLTRRSLDARGRPRWVCHVEVSLVPGARLRGKSLPRGVEEAQPQQRWEPPRLPVSRRGERVVVIGAGPAGLFCAHRLALAGLEPVVVDRGQPVEVRGRHVSRLMHHGELIEDSNICFGEGGAGTWSDGKLYTRVNDIRGQQVLETIVALGGPPEILVSGKPHLGTDRLVRLCKAFRAELEERGCQVRFGSFVEDLALERSVEGDRAVGVRLRGGELVEADRVVLAVGHSAREMYRWLAARGVAMEAKPFAVGFRVEHPQALIDEIQYGRWAGQIEGLPTADYRLTANYGDGDSHRGVYSFCMCPGGQIVCSATEPGGICVNGMSHASRRGHWANAALVVSIRPEDYATFAGSDLLERYGGVLAGVAFQKEAERRAYERGGGGFIAPAQRLTDYLAGRAHSGGELRKTTYKPGVAAAPLEECYPEVVNSLLRASLERFDQKMRGFLTEEALLVGVETRSSAPVRIVRDEESLQSLSMQGFYPCGEGAGYGGGIVSAAIDGLRVADRILEELAVPA